VPAPGLASRQGSYVPGWTQAPAHAALRIYLRQHGVAPTRVELHAWNTHPGQTRWVGDGADATAPVCFAVRWDRGVPKATVSGFAELVSPVADKRERWRVATGCKKVVPAHQARGRAGDVPDHAGEHTLDWARDWGHRA
jgi:hypothetical protein